MEANTKNGFNLSFYLRYIDFLLLATISNDSVGTSHVVPLASVLLHLDTVLVILVVRLISVPVLV